MDERVTAKDYQLIAAQVLKILKKNKKEQEINWDFSAAASKGDIIGLKDTIADNKNDTKFSENSRNKKRLSRKSHSNFN